MVLLFYIFNSIYFGSKVLSIILFIVFITIQLIRMRKQIKKLTHLQKIIILSILVTSIVFLILLFIMLNHLINVGFLSYTDMTIGLIQITLIVTYLVIVTSLIRNVYLRYTTIKA